MRRLVYPRAGSDAAVESAAEDRPIPSPPDSPRASRDGLAVFLVLLAVSVATLPGYGLTWDEAYYFRSQDEQRAWWRLLREDPGRALTKEEVVHGWHRVPYEDCHPPFYEIVSVALAVLVRDLPDPIVAYRLAPCLFFAAGGWGLFGLLRRRRPRGEALVAVALWATTPPIFAHAHFGATDTPIAAFAVLATWAFLVARESPARAALLGLVLGAAAATKLTGLLLPAPLVVWSLLRRDRAGLLALLRAAPVAALVAYAAVPYWWHDPVGGVLEHLRFSFSRESVAPIAVAFAGKVYGFAAPWYLPLAVIAVATPLTLWLPAVAGGLLALRRREPEELLVLLAGALALAPFLTPLAPKHDGVRLFLHAFPFAAALAARAWTDLGTRLGALAPRPRPALLLAPALLAVVAQGVSVARYHPFQLSYYNVLVGGLSGAAERGMEVTFWLDAVTPDVRAELDRLLPPRAVVSTTFVDPVYFAYLQEKGLLRRDVLYLRSPQASYQLVVSRVSHLRRETLAKLGRTPALYTRSFQGVPLVRLFHFPGGLPAPGTPATDGATAP